jgi:hypothetical protein
MEINICQAKTSIVCDNCKTTVALPKKGKPAADKTKSKENLDQPLALDAILEDGQGGTRDFQFCDEECLRQFLNGRAKKKVAKASVIEIDFKKI